MTFKQEWSDYFQMIARRVESSKKHSKSGPMVVQYIWCKGLVRAQHDEEFSPNRRSMVGVPALRILWSDMTITL